MPHTSPTVLTAVRIRSPANANGWPDRSTDRWSEYDGTDALVSRENALGAYWQWVPLSCTSASIHVLVTPDRCRRFCVLAASSPDSRSHECSPQSRDAMDTVLAHSCPPRSTMEPRDPRVHSAMQYGKHPESLNVSTHATSMRSLLHMGRTYSAAWAVEERRASALGDVTRLTGQRIDSSRTLAFVHPM
jgi:hypothetical protein